MLWVIRVTGRAPAQSLQSGICFLFRVKAHFSCCTNEEQINKDLRWVDSAASCWFFITHKCSVFVSCGRCVPGARDLTTWRHCVPINIHERLLESGCRNIHFHYWFFKHVLLKLLLPKIILFYSYMSAKLGVSLPNLKKYIFKNKKNYVCNCIFHAKVGCGILSYDGNDMKSADSYICAENVFHKKEKWLKTGLWNLEEIIYMWM